MDLFSHALLPYLLGYSFKRNRQEVTAFVTGGIAPDFDVFILWIQYLYPTFFLITHRGITHSLFFGFFTGLVIFYLASRGRIKDRIRKYINFEPVISRRTVAFAYAGVVLHLFLDYVTTRGVPLLYPFDTTRYSAEVFFYTDTYLTILSLAIIIILYKKPRLRNNNVKFLAVFLIIFAFLGGLRIAEKNSAEDFFKDMDIKAYPTMSPFEWYILGGDSDTIKIYGYSGIERTFSNISAVPRLNIAAGGENLDTALGVAGELPQIKMFKWRAYAVAINATSEKGTWSLEYYDPFQRAMVHNAPGIFRRAATNFSSIRVRVEAGQAVIL